MMHLISCHNPRLLDRHQEFDGARRRPGCRLLSLASAVNCKPMPGKGSFSVQHLSRALALQGASRIGSCEKKFFPSRLASQAGWGVWAFASISAV